MNSDINHDGRSSEKDNTSSCIRDYADYLFLDVNTKIDQEVLKLFPIRLCALCRKQSKILEKYDG